MQDSFDPSVEENELLTALQQITQEGGDNNVLIVDLYPSKGYYVQFRASNGGSIIEVEVVSNAFLETDNQLDDAQVALLLDKGWSAPDFEMGNFQKSFQYTKGEINFEALLDTIDFLYDELFKVPEDTAVEISIQLG